MKLKPYHHGFKFIGDLAAPSPITHFTAKNLATIYGITPYTHPLHSTRTNIAIIELGGNYHIQDLNDYWQLQGYTSPNIPVVTSISVDGASYLFNSNEDNDIEVALDIQVIGGICPYSNIFVYFAPNTIAGFYDAINAAINNVSDPVSLISISWGAPEADWPYSALTSYNTLFSTAATKGITCCVASGDSGSSDGLRGLNVDFPASSQYVLSCGGTTLKCPNLSYNSTTTSEVAWTGSGGGFSSVFTMPSYQHSHLTAVNSIWKTSTNRGVPDICSDADPNTGILIIFSGREGTVGGTSGAAPLWAAFLATIGCNVFVPPILYGVPDEHKFHDIIKGSNGEYTARADWDPTTGLGSPNGITLTSV